MRHIPTIDVFAKNCIALKTASGDATPIILMTNVPLTADMKKGESDGDSSTAGTKAKPGRQRQDSDSDSMSEYFYLQNADGTTVSKEVISRMSEKAQAIWEALDERGLAPPTFDNISEIAWDFYARIMLNDPEFFFLQLCDDGQWKLKEWSNSSYSSWYDNRGQEKAESNDSILDDTNPVQLGSTNKTVNKIDRDSRNGDDESGSKVNNTETPPTQLLTRRRENLKERLPLGHSKNKRQSRPLPYRLTEIQLGIYACATGTNSSQEDKDSPPSLMCISRRCPIQTKSHSRRKCVQSQEQRRRPELPRSRSATHRSSLSGSTKYEPKTGLVNWARPSHTGFYVTSVAVLSLLRPLLVSWTLTEPRLPFSVHVNGPTQITLKMSRFVFVSSSLLLLRNLGINYSGRSCCFRRFNRTSPDWPTSLSFRCINSMDRSP
ncbi:hypothetical protein EDB85DRAFT_627729 [Lactarius pseudohatsudake]|nr:hypothetical protein EDB85DRAFT_627729 [Lactarius pseudohatsudake]